MKKILSLFLLLALCGSAFANPWGGTMLLSSTRSGGGVVPSSTTFVIVENNDGSNLETSTNGVTYLTPSGVAENGNFSVAYNGSVYSVGCQGSPCLGQYSTNLTSWTTFTGPASFGNMLAMTANSSGFVAVNADTKSAVSTDGHTYTNAGTLPVNQAWHGLATNGSIFCAAGDSGGSTEAYSTNQAVSWSSTTFPFSDTWESIVWDGTNFIAVADNGGSGTTHSGTSTDCQTWTGRTLPSSDAWISVAASSSIVCAISNTSSSSNKAAYSTNHGANWSASTLPASRNWKSVGWNGTVFLAVANNSTGSATSTDCQTWTGRTMAASHAWTGVTK